MKPAPTKAGRYLVEAVACACDVTDGEALRLCDITARTGLSKTTAFRILFALEKPALWSRASGIPVSCALGRSIAKIASATARNAPRWIGSTPTMIG